VDDWAAEALDGLAAKTVRSHVDLLGPVTMLIGNIPLRDLTAHDVRRALNKLAETRSTRTMASTHNVLVRAIRHAEANDRVGRNVATFVKPPQGKTGRPSRAMTAAEAAALLAAARDDRRLGAYVILSLTTGIRTEEARALRWDHVDLDGDPAARLPVPPSVAVWRSVRAHSDTKTEKSRRTLALPQSAVAALKEQRRWQAEARLAAGPLWHDDALVFTTSVGTPLDASHVRRGFRALCKKAGITGVWAPRELRHTFVSVMSNSGVAVEEIAHLAGHASSRTTETWTGLPSAIPCPPGGRRTRMRSCGPPNLRSPHRPRSSSSPPNTTSNSRQEVNHSHHHHRCRRADKNSHCQLGNLCYPGRYAA